MFLRMFSSHAPMYTRTVEVYPMSESRLILILEPKNEHARVLEWAFERASVRNPGRVVRTEDELRTYLRGAGVYGNRELFPMPSLLLVAFGAPSTDLALIRWLRDEKYLDRFPLVGMGNRVMHTFLQLAFNSGLNGYFEKPNELSSLAKMISELEWIDGPSWDPAKIGTQLITKETLFKR